MSYIVRDDKRIKRLLKEAQQFQDDIVCAVDTDFMKNIAEAENRMIFDILKGLESEPTADVVEVRHGYWNTSDTILGRCCVCSECGSCPTMEYKYCPYCGAKMDGERREDNNG